MNNYVTKDLIQTYLPKLPYINTFLSINQKIKKEQISDLDTVDLSNYYNKQQVDLKISQIQITPTDLFNYYNKQQVDLKISQIQITSTDLSNYYNKQQVDQQIKSIDLSNCYDKKTIDFKVVWCIPISPPQLTLIDLRYYFTVPQIKGFEFWLDSYLIGKNYINLNNAEAFLKDYAKQKDLSNFVLTTDLQANYYNKSQIDLKFSNLPSGGGSGDVDLSKYMLINTTDATQTNKNIKVFVEQITDMNSFLKSQSLIRQSQYSSDLQNCLKSNIMQLTALSPFYTITTGAITDLDSYMVNYVLKTDILNLKNYMKDNIIQPTKLNSNYQLSYVQITDLNDQFNKFINQQQLNQQLTLYYSSSPAQQKQLHPYYSILSSQISDVNFKKIMRNDISDTTPFNINYTISNKQIPDLNQFYTNYITLQYLNQQLLQYCVLSPSQNIQLNSNYKILISQITDFDTQVKNYINSSSSSSSYYLFKQPPNQTILDENYKIQTINILDKQITFQQIADNSIQGFNIGINAITGQNLAASIGPDTLQKECVSYKHFDFDYISRRFNITGNTFSNIDQQNAQTFCNYAAPLGFTNTSYVLSNGQNLSQQISLKGATSFLMNNNAFGDNLGIDYAPDSQFPYNFIQFDSSKMIYNSQLCGSYGISQVSNHSNFKIPLLLGFSGDCVVSVGGSNVIHAFCTYTNPQAPVSFITNAGQYQIQSEENLKDNITIKTNYLEQLNKLLKLNIVTYSYGKKYGDLIKQKYEELKDQNISQQDKEYIQQQIDDIQQISGKAIQGYTYQNLQECGFNNVLQDKQIMSDQYFDQKQYDKEKQTKSICETQMIPYTIMGIKALNEKIENISQRLDIIDQAMMKTHEIINEVSSQTGYKIQDVQNISLLHSIYSDNIDDIKNSLNKLIYQFDQQQNVIKKYQSQIILLQSQCEQLKNTVDKQQSDITNLKLKTKMAN